MIACAAPRSLQPSVLTSLQPRKHTAARQPPLQRTQVIIERMDRLKPGVHLTLKVASVMGQWVDLDILHRFYPINKSKVRLPGWGCVHRGLTAWRSIACRVDTWQPKSST